MLVTSDNVLSSLMSTLKDAHARIIEIALNEIYAADPLAIHTLLETRVPCDAKIETDTKAVPYRDTDDSPLSIGPLGLLNALAGLGGMVIIAKYGDTESGLCRLVGFEVKVKETKSGDAKIQSGDGPEFREDPSIAQGSSPPTV